MTPPDKNNHHKRRIYPTTRYQRKAEWLTAAVGVWGLCRAILQAVQDLSFAHVAVSDQQELEQVVVALHWAALASHPDVQQKQGRLIENSSCQQGRWAPRSHPQCSFQIHPKTLLIPSTFSRGWPEISPKFQSQFFFHTEILCKEQKCVPEKGCILTPKITMGIVWTQVVSSRGEIWCQQLGLSFRQETDRL